MRTRKRKVQEKVRKKCKRVGGREKEDKESVSCLPA